ncbi:MAG: phage/plasmid replication protein, II/X family [Candidatus Gottesmanbacteria bacterium]|nr:phage/plasmid replication protein, II/X family [Candidatus Gottesmanbacteria bacterium]
MIDTIGFQVAITNKQAELIRLKSNEVVSTDNETSQLKFRIIKKQVTLGSYDSKITIRSYDDETAHVELSFPKFVFGHNVYLLYPSQIEATASMLQERLREYFGDFPPFKEWRVERLDICYAWRFQDQRAALHALSVLKAFDYPRKQKHIYTTSVQWSGRTYSLKFYLKLDEFQAHGLKELKDTFFSGEVLKLADGVLRFEVTCRKAQLFELFDKKEIYISNLKDEDFFVSVLDHFLTKLLANLNPHTTNNIEVLNRLRKTFSNRKAQLLMHFYKEWYSTDVYDRQLLKDAYCQSTIWRKKHDLSVAGVGLPAIDVPLDFSLDIPSDKVVNLPVALAAARGLGEYSNTA